MPGPEAAALARHLHEEGDLNEGTISQLLCVTRTFVLDLLDRPVVGVMPGSDRWEPPALKAG